MVASMHVGIAPDGLVGNGQVLGEGDAKRSWMWPGATSVSPRHLLVCPKHGSHLLHCIEHVLVEVLLGVDSVGVLGPIHIVLQEEVLEGDGVLLLEGHHHLVAEAKQDELRDKDHRDSSPVLGTGSTGAQNAAISAQR